MANYDTSADLLDDILDRAGEPTDGTSDFNTAAIRYLNRAYQGIWKGGSELDSSVNEVWWWLRKDDQGTIILDPLYNTGSISVTNNSASITFSSAPTFSLAGRHVKVNDHADVFVLTAHTASQVAGTLESVYTGTTFATAAFRAMRFDYDLATDVIHISSPFFAYQDNIGEIDGIALDELRSKWPLNNAHSGVPKNFSMIGQRKVRFSHYGGEETTDLIKLDYEYIFEPADLVDDSAQPLVPREYRKILADWALAFLLEDKEDSKAGDALGLAINGVKAMAAEQRRRMNRMGGKDFARIHPRAIDLEHLTGPLRTESGHIIG